MFKWQIGDGKTIKFWRDWWWGSEPLSTTFTRLFNLARDKDITVASLRNNGRNYIRNIWKRQLRGWECDAENQLLEIIENLRLSSDRHILQWTGNNNKLTVQDLYKKIDQGRQPSNTWKMIWNLKIPPRIQLFIWILCNKVLPVRDFLHKRISNVIMNCPLCDHHT